MSGSPSARSRTIVAADGRVLVFSADDFVTRICDGEACFVCGAPPGSKEFNNEHVIPRWILQRFSLFDRRITLPNGRERPYSSHVMPCCTDCNSHLARTLEDVVADLFEGGYDLLIAELNAASMELVFIWLCLLFTKLHLKDRAFKWHPDQRREEGFIADRYDWVALHHLHCVARSTYTGARLGPHVMGTVRFFRVEDAATREQFDWLDLTQGQTLALRLNDIGIVAVLNDASMTSMMLSHVLADIAEPIDTVALREIAARLAMANEDLTSRPEFATFVVDSEPTSRTAIQASVPRSIECDKFSPERLGANLELALRGQFGRLQIDGDRDPERVRRLVRSGRVSFL